MDLEGARFHAFTIAISGGYYSGERKQSCARSEGASSEQEEGHACLLRILQAGGRPC